MSAPKGDEPEVVGDAPALVVVSAGLGGVGCMASVFLAAVVAALVVLVWVVVAFPSQVGDGSAVPTSRPLGPCEPFCSLRTTTPMVSGGAR
ncbi:hypothetical protein DFR70_13040 [Nocardia tenerifensis]|uniref:Uncharacterized protein n=1 Tax=Nocardia tenerifensis TaxID=228006 RepID=A0A318JQM8_9NOCA|nr:hypothetical protein [Nocardia tenerifensis]PXX52792.1 hypothetical protein DFR70_13040 [Nocardia tenerifensis]